MELSFHSEAAIKYPHYHLPKDLDQHNAAKVAVPFWYQDNGPSGALLRKVTLAEGGLDQANDHLPL